MNNSSPLVSVLMTSHNRQDYIAASIESVLASTYTHFELIVVDDCSTDNTLSIARSYEQKDSRVKVYLNPKNLGDYRNRNQAASYAKGTYLKYLDSDDLIFPWGLQVMVMCMEQYPEAAFGTSANREEIKMYPMLYSPKEVLRAYYYSNNILAVGPTAAIIKRDAFESVGGFSGENYFGDIELWLKLASKYPVLHLPPGLIYWRIHEGQETNSEKKEDKDKADLIEQKRLELDIRTLQDSACPLEKEEAQTIIQNLKNIKSRNAVKMALQGEPVRALRKLKQFDIGFAGFLKALKKNIVNYS